MPFDPETPQQAPEPQPFDAALKELVEALGAVPAAEALVEGGASPRDAVQAVEQVAAEPRRVSAPTHTLRGQRMPGSRAMTVQEQTMLERPWLQMGRDAGAFSSRAVNTAGFGLPGVVLQHTAPNALAGIQENESLANPGVTAGGTAAGLYMMPINALGKGLGKVGEAFASLPWWARGGAVAAPAAALPSEAGPPGGAVKDYEAPGLVREIWNALPGVTVQDERPLSQDEFRQQRRQLQPRSRAEYIQSEVDKVRDTERYQTAGRGLRENLENAARSNAEKLYAGYEKDFADETARIDREYGDYRTGWDTQRREHLNKQFVERHPTTGMALTVGGPVASAIATRGIFGKVNKLGEEIATAGNAARASDDMRALADSIVRADRYATYAPLTKAATAIEAAALPAELRMTADIIDKKALPPEAGARKAAEERMADWSTYSKGMGYDVVSGAIGTGTGSLWAKWHTPSPGVNLHALRNNAAGLERGGWPEWLRGQRVSQDELSKALTERAISAAEAQSRLNAARSGAPAPPAGSAGMSAPAPYPAQSSSAASPTGGALVPQGSYAPEASAPRLSDRVRANQSRIDEALPSPPPSSQPRLPEGHQWDDRMLGSKNRGPDGRVHSMPQDTTAKPKGKKRSDAGQYFPWLWNRLAG